MERLTPPLLSLRRETPSVWCRKDCVQLLSFSLLALLTLFLVWFTTTGGDHESDRQLHLYIHLLPMDDRGKGVEYYGTVLATHSAN